MCVVTIEIKGLCLETCMGRTHCGTFIFTDFFPIRFVESGKTVEIHLKPGNQQNYKRLEIYEVRANYEGVDIKQDTENDGDSMQMSNGFEKDDEIHSRIREFINSGNCCVE
jgi:hypothetical protein